MGKNKLKKKANEKNMDVKKIKKYSLMAGLITFIIGAVLWINGFITEKREVETKFEKAYLETIETSKLSIREALNHFRILGISIQTRDNFEEAEKIYDVIENDFENYEAVGFVKNGIVEKVFGSNSSITVGDNLSNYYGVALRSFEVQSGVETVDMCQNKEGDIVALVLSPAYIYENNSQIYLGEYFALVNYSKLVRETYKGQNFEIIIDMSLGSDKVYNLFKTVNEISSKEYVFVYDHEYTGYDMTYYVHMRTVDLMPSKILGLLKLLQFVVIAIIVAFIVKFVFTNYLKQKEESNIRETKYDFVTNVIYEIRTSTNSIISYLSDIGDDVSQATKENIESSRKELDKLLHKINNMLDITNIRWSNYSKYDEQYYMTVMIDELSYEYKDKISELDVQWLVDIADNLPIKFKGRKTSIKKMLEHVINNSLKLMVDGHVKISVYGSYISPKEDKMKINFVISDTGIGIKEENISDIYKPSNSALYLEGNSMEEAKTELYIAKEICKSLDGEFKVTSEYGKGTVVTCTIIQDVIDKRVMTQDLLIGLEEKFRKNLGRLRTATADILVVDDNEVNLSMMGNLISKYGCTVETAKNGEIAALLCAEKEYDLIFIDQLMPGLDGFETLKQIREYKINKTTPAVLVTANSYDKDSAFEESGFEELIFKPLSVNDVEKVLKLLLPIECITCQEVDN